MQYVICIRKLRKGYLIREQIKTRTIIVHRREDVVDFEEINTEKESF